ncbi:MAG: PQQ-binding-like beta-propeller repeat protein, partial [Acidobacteriota bacterium]
MSRAAEASPALRLWPGAVLLALLGISRLGVRNALEGFEGFSLAIQGTLGAGALIVLWWLFLSRAPWLERLGALAVLVGGLAASYFLRHESMGPHWLAVYAVPTACAALVIGALASRGREPAARRLVMAALLVLTAGGWTLLRTTGIDGNHAADFQWRWSPTAEAQMLTDGNLEPAIAAPREAAEDPALAAAAQWPGFRGAARDGVVRGLEIETDWQASPPRELWRRPVGPGWSSFAVLGDRIFTHEQRGEEETVSAYRLDSGEPVWRHADPVRFFESNAGAGPRATPAVAEGRVFSYGATGILNALDAATGAVLWSRDVAAEAEAKLPSWGFSSSPLVTDGLVIVDARGLFAYDVATGEPRWRGPSGAVHYTSPQIFTVDGVRQVVFTGGEETVGLAIDDGSRLWGYEWPGFTMVQPAQAEDGDLLVGAGA